MTAGTGHIPRRDAFHATLSFRSLYDRWDETFTNLEPRVFSLASRYGYLSCSPRRFEDSGYEVGHSPGRKQSRENTKILQNSFFIQIDVYDYHGSNSTVLHINGMR